MSTAMESIRRRPWTREEAARAHREWLLECEPYNRLVCRIYATATPKMFVIINPDGSTRLESAGCVLPDDMQATVDWCRTEVRRLAQARGLIQPTED